MGAMAVLIVGHERFANRAASNRRESTKTMFYR
jgi:hypothetical protein